MAHFLLEYSNNVTADELRVDALFEALHRCAVASGEFPAAGLRSRAVGYDQYRVATGDPAFAFVNLSVKVGAGRPVEIRKRVGGDLFRVLTDHLAPVRENHRLAISFEMRELDSDVKFNLNDVKEAPG